MVNNYKGILIYTVTHNDFILHVNGSASASLTLKNSTLTINAITCGSISCTGPSTKPTTPSIGSVYVGLDNAAAGQMDICASSSAYIDFTTINNDFKGKMLYVRGDNSFSWQVGGSGQLI